MTTFAKRIKELRLQANKTLEQIAIETGISKTALSYYETDQREAGISVLIRLAKYYGESTDYLLGLEDEDGHKETIEYDFEYSHKDTKLIHKERGK